MVNSNDVTDAPISTSFQRKANVREQFVNGPKEQRHNHERSGKGRQMQHPFRGRQERTEELPDGGDGNADDQRDQQQASGRDHHQAPNRIAV